MGGEGMGKGPSDVAFPLRDKKVPVDPWRKRTQAGGRAKVLEQEA